ncbi:MAG: hypothetical protein ACOCQD_00960 [archaeon]
MKIISTDNKHQWIIKFSNNKEFLLKLQSSSMSNSFSIIKDFINDTLKEYPEIHLWYENLVQNYIESDFDSNIILRESDNFLYYATSYVDSVGIDFSKFINKKKISKTSIVFDEKDIRNIAISSAGLKLFGIFTCDVNLRLPENAHREVYSKILSPCIQSKDNQHSVMTKIFQLIISRTYRSSISNKTMWDLIKLKISETPDTHAFNVFNFLCTELIFKLEIETNPIPFLTGIVDKSIVWLMRGAYKDKIIHGEVYYAGTDEIYGHSISKESFNVYCCNDVLAKTANLAMNIIENEFCEGNQETFDNVSVRLDNIKTINPIDKTFSLPIMSKVLDIPYTQLLSSPPKHVFLLGILLYYFENEYLSSNWPLLSETLYSTSKDESKDQITKSTYQIKDYLSVISDEYKIFGFNSKMLKYEVLSTLAGIINSSRKNLISIITNRSLSKGTYSDLEREILSFYTKFFAGDLDEIFKQTCTKIEEKL